MTAFVLLDAISFQRIEKVVKILFRSVVIRFFSKISAIFTEENTGTAVLLYYKAGKQH